jgi:hypothetical protein
VQFPSNKRRLLPGVSVGTHPFVFDHLEQGNDFVQRQQDDGIKSGGSDLINITRCLPTGCTSLAIDRTTDISFDARLVRTSASRAAVTTFFALAATHVRFDAKSRAVAPRAGSCAASAPAGDWLHFFLNFAMFPVYTPPYRHPFSM